ncbi:DJ-1/PfpI family protein [bacterium]|nr:DJ-1/PfpI family protein [bacterium]
MSKTVLVPVADGSEEMETVVVVDTLRRAGAAVTVAAVVEGTASGGLDVTCSRGVRLVADKPLTSCRDEIWDLVVLPGGLPGAEHLRDSRTLAYILRAQAAAGRPYAGICASPGCVLAAQGLLEGRTATAHPNFMDHLPRPSEERVVVDGGVVTSRGPGTALEFALALVGLLFGDGKRREIAREMLAPGA